ncbi:MAG TPA: transketolase [Ilumatobacteraceae bacterium]|nr:transketolase [Ilumatobacteraceae bacterium]
MPLTEEQDQLAVSLIRGMAMDGPLAANSGHQGTAMALAPLGHVLYSRVMKHDPSDPAWPDRDRFVLSNGHASILQYSLLFLCGYGLELDDLRNFRQWGSATPGHPEAGHTAGVEVTTGPLGQGFANAVGMAIAEENLRARFGAEAQDHFTFVIVGDGCLMEGISHEAASLAGHLGLGKLICVFDDNLITIDGPTSMSTSDDTAMRFRAYGWDVVDLGEMADDLDGLEAALQAAKAQTDRPSLLMLRSHIGEPSPDHTDTHGAHGNPFTADDVTRTKEVMGIPDEPFWAPDDLVAAYRLGATERGAAARSAWTEASAAVTSTPEWQAAWAAGGTTGWDADLPAYDLGESLATRKAIQKALDATYDHLPGLISGSADLTGSNGTGLARTTAFTADDRSGRYVHYGIREHAMGAALVGMALHGGTLPIGGTFFVFSDYMRPSIRLAALSKAKACFVFTHDSVGVGEDGPTHQPVEQLAALRAIPDLHVVRPADGNETIQAWADIVRHDGPSALILSRQNIKVVTDGSAVARGAGIVSDSEGAPELVLVATGSEVEVCVDAAVRLRAAGRNVRVVSLPSWDRFSAQDETYRDSIMPAGVPTLSVEAATTFGWERWSDDSIGIDRFGASAPGELVLERLGINVDHVVERANALLD